MEVMKLVATSFKRSHARTATLSVPTLQQATTNPCLCQRHQDTHRQVWVSLLWGHCSFLQGPGAHKVLFVPSKSLFPQSCVSSGSSMAGLMVTSPKRAYVIPRSTAPRSLCPSSSSLLTHTPSGDTQTQFCLSVCRASGSWCTQGMFEPSKHLWRVWGLILNAILPLLLSCWGFSFALGHGVSPQRMHEIQLHFACHENKQKNMSNNEDKSQSIRTDSERTQI